MDTSKRICVYFVLLFLYLVVHRYSARHNGEDRWDLIGYDMREGAVDKLLISPVGFNIFARCYFAVVIHLAVVHGVEGEFIGLNYWSFGRSSLR